MKKSEETFIELKVKQQIEPKMFSLEHIQNEVLTINSEHPSYQYRFEIKLTRFLHLIKTLKIRRRIDRVQGRSKMETNKFSPEQVQNEVLILTSKISSSEDCFDTKLQAKFDKFDQIFKQPEGKMMDFI